MFPNLDAEQARHCQSNTEAADLLGISRTAYERKKREAAFTIREANTLCEVYQCEYAYLFAQTPLVPRSWTELEAIL